MGAAVHADNLRSTTASAEAISQQNAVINQFDRDSCLSLNTKKTEIVKISPFYYEEAIVQLESHTLPTANAAKCLGVWCNSSLSARHSIHENISKARRAFFALGRLGDFQGDLNSLSSCNIFETCIIPTLLYGCETWLLDSTALESFQHEIGCHILRVPKFYSKASVRIALHWPTVTTRTLIRKLNFLSKLLSGSNDTISKRVFSSLAVEDVYESSIVQQCRMLEFKPWTPAFWPNACLTLRTLLMLSDQAKKAFYAPISIYYYQPPLTVRHLLPSSPPTRHGIDCGMLHLIKVSRALVLFNPSSRSYVVQVYALSVTGMFL